jgi:hypothetical protein
MNNPTHTWEHADATPGPDGHDRWLIAIRDRQGRATAEFEVDVESGARPWVQCQQLAREARLLHGWALNTGDGDRGAKRLQVF